MKARTCTVFIGDEEWTAHFHYSPGSPGCHTQRNGDPGWPPDPPEVEVESLTRVTPGGGFSVVTHPEILAQAEQACLDAAIQQDEDDMIEYYESRHRCE